MGGTPSKSQSSSELSPSRVVEQMEREEKEERGDGVAFPTQVEVGVKDALPEDSPLDPFVRGERVAQRRELDVPNVAEMSKAEQRAYILKNYSNGLLRKRMLSDVDEGTWDPERYKPNPHRCNPRYEDFVRSVVRLPPSQVFSTFGTFIRCMRSKEGAEPTEPYVYLSPEEVIKRGPRKKRD